MPSTRAGVNAQLTTQQTTTATAFAQLGHMFDYRASAYDAQLHRITVNSPVPTVSAQGATTVIGSTGVASLESGTDASFIVKLIISGTPPSASGLLFTVTYGKAYVGIPQVACTIDLPTTATAMQTVNPVTGGGGATLSLLCSNVLSTGTYYFHVNVQQ